MALFVLQPLDGHLWAPKKITGTLLLRRATLQGTRSCTDMLTILSVPLCVYGVSSSSETQASVQFHINC